MLQLKQTTITYMGTPLAVRQKSSTPRRPGASGTSLSTTRQTSRRMTSPPQHQEDVEIIVQDDSSDEADDEDEEFQKPGKPISLSSTESNPQGSLDAPQMKLKSATPKSATQRPLRRFWFDHVSSKCYYLRQDLCFSILPFEICSIQICAVVKNKYAVLACWSAHLHFSACFPGNQCNLILSFTRHFRVATILGVGSTLHWDSSALFPAFCISLPNLLF